MIVPRVQPPGQGQAQGVTARDAGTAFGLDVCVLGPVRAVGNQVPVSTNPALGSRRLSGLLAAFLPRFLGSLNLTGSASSGSPSGFKLQICRFYCVLAQHACVGQGPGAREADAEGVCLSGVSCRAVFRKGDGTDGRGEDPLTFCADVEAWAVHPGGQVAPPSWAGPGGGGEGVGVGLGVGPRIWNLSSWNLSSSKVCCWLFTEGRMQPSPPEGGFYLLC